MFYYFHHIVRFDKGLFPDLTSTTVSILDATRVFVNEDCFFTIFTKTFNRKGGGLLWKK